MTTSTRETPTWDDSQAAIICSQRNARLVVQAGPGTGKTAVACERVANLINSQGCDPACIHVISFTRTAVAELRARIAASAGARGAGAVRISTLDSRAWQLLYGFSGHEASSLLGDFETNITRVLELLRTERDELLDSLDMLEHLVVDEAQDLVGLRSTLVQEMIKRLPVTCGVTVLADDAQAIYGFSEKREEGEEEDDGDEAGHDQQPTAPGFVESLRAAAGHKVPFQERDLPTVWRCSSPELKRLFTETRREVLTKKDSLEKLRDLKEGIFDAADEIRGQLPDNVGDDTLVLFRRRREVLDTSARLAEERKSHRLRVSGLPSWPRPWIGWLLCTWMDQELPRHVFEELWTARSATAPLLFAGIDPAEGWRVLASVAPGEGDDGIDTLKLRRLLGRARPPVELCMPDFGTHGPIIGTIHASKGREADRVVLQLPRTVGESPGCDMDEECRVFFVGATRARRALEVIDAGRLPGYKRNRRLDRYNRRLTNSVQVELGLDGDVVPLSVMKAPVVSGDDEAMALQSLLAQSVGRVQPLIAYGSPETTEWRYSLWLSDGPVPRCVGSFSGAVSRDVRHLRGRLGGQANQGPGELKHLHLIGARTVSVPADSEELETLGDPFRRSGFFLAPVVRGLSMIYS